MESQRKWDRENNIWNESDLLDYHGGNSDGGDTRIIDNDANPLMRA